MRPGRGAVVTHRSPRPLFRRRRLSSLRPPPHAKPAFPAPGSLHDPGPPHSGAGHTSNRHHGSDSTIEGAPLGSALAPPGPVREASHIRWPGRNRDHGSAVPPTSAGTADLVHFGLQANWPPSPGIHPPRPDPKICARRAGALGGPRCAEWEDVDPSRMTARGIHVPVDRLSEGTRRRETTAPGDTYDTTLIPEKSSGSCCGLDGADGPNMVMPPCRLITCRRLREWSQREGSIATPSTHVGPRGTCSPRTGVTAHPVSHRLRRRGIAAAPGATGVR